VKILKLPKLFIRLGIRFYQKFINPILHFVGGPYSGCRFTPSCSNYCLEAVERHGVVKGLFYGTRRICRCHPWGGCGEDPVPPKKEIKK